MATKAAPEKDALAVAFEQLQEAQKEEDADKAATMIAEALGGLDQAQMRRVLENPAVAELVNRVGGKVSAAPGTKLRDAKGRLYGKVPWTVEAMKETYADDMIRWVPPQTRTLIVNGVEVHVVAGEETYTPRVFQSVAYEAYNAELNQRKNAEDIMRKQFGSNGYVGDIA